MAEWNESDQFWAQCIARGIDADDVVAQLPACSAAKGRHHVRIGMDDYRVFVKDNTVQSITRMSVVAPPPKRRPPPLSRHARIRAAERNVSPRAIAQALATPRLPGGKHCQNGLTVVVGSHRGGEAVATVW